jgi:hypothetical protein
MNMYIYIYIYITFADVKSVSVDVQKGIGSTVESHGLALVLSETSVLQVREEAYDLLLTICEFHPLLRASDSR